MKLEAHKEFLLTTNTKSNIIRTHCHPMQGNVDSGIREIFACGILNPGLWNPEQSLRSPESHFRFESGVPVQLTKNSETNTQNPESMAWNPESTTVLDSLTRGKHWLNVYIYALQNSLEALVPAVCIGNSMICSDIGHKFHE